MNITTKTLEIGGRTFTFEIGRLAQQATSTVLASSGDTMVLATIVIANERPDLGYFPLSVEYIERLYAGGRIKGSRWVKREGRPSDEAILKGRLIDRSIRPLFPKGFSNEIQVCVTVLSVDGENDPDIISINAVSAALAISPIPWDGPIGAVRLGFVPPKAEEEGHFLVNPALSEIEFCDMDMVVSSTADKIHMIEASASEVPDSIVGEGLKAAKNESKVIIDTIEDLVKKLGKPKMKYKSSFPSDELLKNLKKDYKKEIEILLHEQLHKESGTPDASTITDEIYIKYGEKFDKKEIEKALDYLVKQKIREDILQDEKRPDGRKIDDIREITSEVGILPRTHGSAIFSRGQTQVLTVATLGAPSLEQLIESPMGEESKRFMHHYSMPPYSVGETGRIGFPSRREIGHGALAEKALEAVIPMEDTFPYTIRLVSEVMSSNGSTSMASTCGSTLALMDAGVPIKNSVAGIAMGLMTHANKYKILTDIIGLEDFSGDMDFKIAGTKVGITAIQLDVKIEGLTDEMIDESITRAQKARLFILDKMLKVLPSFRAQISQYAPKVVIVKVPQDKIGEVIGPGGRVIRAIIAETGATVDVDDEGNVSITGTSDEGVNRARSWVENLVKEVQPNEEYEGIVKRIMPFGAFVEIIPGKEGLVHVSQMASGYVSDPNQIVKIGDKVKVRVAEIDEQKRINLSMLFGEDAKKPIERRPPRQGGGDRRTGFRRRH
ncbi:polyribonucleotide nucleotidyltransferase [Candidatus Gottesmanbacteria bacterium]|nr:polyribonucleotide nucleotidyltransferase [Candidatus Gottesmanbacteria bacterium]